MIEAQDKAHSKENLPYLTLWQKIFAILRALRGKTLPLKKQKQSGQHKTRLHPHSFLLGR